MGFPALLPAGHLEENIIMKKCYRKFITAIPALIYFVIYLTWFYLIEHMQGRDYTIIHMKADDKIPFCEYFIIPYLLWFGYVAWIVIYLFFKNTRDFHKCCRFLFSGMTVFLIISTVFPNIHYLRPSVMPRDNIFCDLVAMLYQIDTSTNLWPSIHVYNSLGVLFAVVHNDRLGSKKWIKWTCFTLTVSIVLSTMFLKQHSVFDVMTAFIMAAVVYIVVYRTELLSNLRHTYEKYRKRKETQWF